MPSNHFKGPERASPMAIVQRAELRLRDDAPGWEQMHALAWYEAGHVSVDAAELPGSKRGRRLVEAGLRKVIEGLAIYAQGYEAELGSKLGADDVIGDHWRDALRAFVGLLNGPTGRYDCGTLDRTARALAVREGFTEDFDEDPR